MFPFTLPGPKFLAFFVAFAAVLILAYLILVRIAEARGRGTPRLNELAANPYQVAFLRGGYAELLQVALFNLVDRGLLTANGTELRCARKRGGDYARQPIDKAILARCELTQVPASLAADPQVKKAAATYEEALRAKGLLLGADAQQLVAWGLRVGLALLLGIAAIRLVQAFGRGQYNVFGLLFVTAMSVLFVYLISRTRLTHAGQAAIKSLAALLRRGQGAERLRPGGATNEALLWAAVFGVWALPSTAFGFIHEMYPRPASSGSDGSSSSDGGDSGGCGGGGGCGGCGG